MGFAQLKRNHNEVGHMQRHVDIKTRERIRAARLRELEFELRQTLEAGGFEGREVAAILSAVMDIINSGQTVTAERLAPQLIQKGFAKRNAEQLSRELSPA